MENQHKQHQIDTQQLLHQINEDETNKNNNTIEIDISNQNDESQRIETKEITDSNNSNKTLQIKLEISTTIYLFFAFVVFIIIVGVFGSIRDLFITINSEYIFLAQLVGVVLSMSFYVLEIISVTIITIVTHFVVDLQKRKFVFGIFLTITSAILAAITLCTAIEGSLEVLNSPEKINQETKLLLEKDVCFFSFKLFINFHFH